MTHNIPEQPKNSFRITLNLQVRQDRMDNVLMEALRAQDESLTMKGISRTALKALFSKGKIHIKGQQARPSSALARGVTYVTS